MKEKLIFLKAGRIIEMNPSLHMFLLYKKDVNFYSSLKTVAENTISPFPYLLTCPFPT